MSTRPELTEATITRTPGGSLVVDVNGMVLPGGDRAHLTDAVHALCEYAVARQQHLVVTVVVGAGRQYMTIDMRGIVAPSAAPAPRSANARPPASALGVSLAVGVNDEATTQQWVDSYILEPKNDPEPAAPVSPTRGRTRVGRLFRR